MNIVIKPVIPYANAPVIRKAERRKAKLRLALVGPTGCGKTSPPCNWRSASASQSA